MKVLIVDDSALARGIIRRTLEQNAAGKGLVLLEAQDGEEAARHLDGGGVDLALTVGEHN